LVRRLRSIGGEVLCGRRARRIEVRNGRAKAVLTGDERFAASRAVIADVDFLQLYRELLDGVTLPSGLRGEVAHFQRDNATFKVDWTLDGPVPWTAERARAAATVHVADSLDALTRQSAQLACREIPDRPYLVFGQYCSFDPSRAPSGKEAAWAYTHVPQEVRSDAAGELTGCWDDREAELFADRVEAQIEALAPGFRRLIRRRHILTPHGLQEANRNLVGGALNGGTAQLHQQLVFRPSPGLARPETPVRGLLLGSAAAHPGGGVHGGPGANAARAALAAGGSHIRARPLSALTRALQR
jgi:phytoene dehydrogenase-like protein